VNTKNLFLVCFRLLAFTSATCIYAKVPILEPLRSTHKTSSLWISHFAGFYIFYLYVKVILTEPLRLPQKTSSRWFHTLLVSNFATCMPKSKSSSLNLLCHNKKPLLGGFHTFLVSISATCMSKFFSLNHLDVFQSPSHMNLQHLIITILFVHSSIHI